ncbi:hypothetical protein ACHAXT_012304 [Thalassiosira profunda]
MADTTTTDQIAEGDLVAHWLRTAHLGHAVDNFAMAGIVTPRSFAELPLNYYEPLGVTEPEDRKKLFFLVQKVKEALKEGSGVEGDVGGGAADGGGVGAPGGGSKHGEGKKDECADEASFKSPSLSKGSNVKDAGVARVLAVATTPNNKHDDVMSHVETTPLHEPISPVTMASPIASVDGRGARAGFFGKPAASAAPLSEPLGKPSVNPLTPREKLQKELDRRARERQEEKKKATEAATKSRATKGRRQSFLPSMAGSAASSRRTSVASHRPKAAVAAEKKRAADDSSNSSSSSEDELDSVRTTPTLKSAASRSIVDARNMRRSSMHHRATVKKTNATRAKPRRYSSIPAPSIERDDDEDSLDSDTSDLSTSVASYRSAKGGCSSAGSSVGTHRSAQSGIGQRHRKDEDENRGNNVDQMRRRASLHKSKSARSGGGASIASTARRGKKPLSTMAEGSLAPLSPLPGLSAAQLDEGIAGASKVVGPARRPARRRSSLGVAGKRPGTADSVRSGGARPKSRSSLGGSAASARRARPLREKPQVASGSSVASRRIKSPVRREKGPAVARARSRSPPPSSRGSNRTPRSARSVSPKRSPRVGVSRPLSAVRGPVRNRPTSPVRSPARGASRPRSPVRSPWNSSTRAGSPKVSPKGSPRRVKSPTGGAGGAVFVHGTPADDSHATQIAQLRRAFAAEHARQRDGREATDGEDGEYEMRIRVIVRKRPMSKTEAGAADADVIQPLEMGSYGRILVHQPKTKLDLAREVETMGFAFDNVFGEGSHNVEIYERAVRGLIPGVFNGRWASVFAYGQTGSGKTFTMMGSNATGMNAGNQTENAGHQNLGLYFLAARDVFDIASDPAHADVSIGVSLFEIYGGKLLDLLNERNPVKCLEDRRGKVCFPGLSEHPVESAEELMSIIDAGALNRSTGTTSANADSSRSHAVLQLSLRKDVGRAKNKEHGRLTFIDLAGSERGADTSKACKTTRMEGAEINTSLLALKEVIRALATGSSMKRIPFRGSKLTQVLKESFVGKKSRTVMVSCVAPNMKNCDHTLNTLRYADRVKERNPETGELSAAVAANSRIQRDEAEDLRVRLPPRPLTAPAASFRIERDESSDESEDDDIPPPPPDNEDHQFRADDAAEEKSAYSEFSYDKSVDSRDSLEEVLRSNDTLPSAPAEVETTSKPPKAKDDPAAQSLIATHKTIMSKLLQMLQHEMTLVNDTDANRDNIDEYLKELGSLSDQQLSLISTLRESLESYNESKNARNEAATKTSASHLLNDHSVDYDDDTFDLGG